jgi:Icc-related predicted phosphoesterase
MQLTSLIILKEILENKKMIKKEEKRKEEKNDKRSEKFKILAAGDIHGDSKLSRELAEKAEKEKVDLIVLTGDIIGLTPSKELIKPFLDKKQKVIFVPGNWETSQEAEELSKKYKIKKLGKHDIGFFGIGNEDWALYHNESAIEDLKRDFSKIRNLEKKILVSHSHAAGTKSELSGIPGSPELRTAIEKFQPDLFLHSHIHELAGAEEKIGKTRVINVGKKGKIIEI